MDTEKPSKIPRPEWYWHQCWRNKEKGTRLSSEDSERDNPWIANWYLLQREGIVLKTATKMGGIVFPLIVSEYKEFQEGLNELPLKRSCSCISQTDHQGSLLEYSPWWETIKDRMKIEQDKHKKEKGNRTYKPKFVKE